MSMLAERKQKQRWSLNPRGKQWTEDSTKFGQKMLERMGWKHGKGLGANEDGMTEHVKLTYKNDQKGMGFKETEQWTEHEDHFSKLLKDLNGGLEKDERDVVKPDSLQEKAENVRTRINYHKFTRGKDLSRYSEKDLANIFGRRSLKPKLVEHEPVVKENAAENKVEGGEGNLINRGSIADYFKEKLAKFSKISTPKYRIGNNGVLTAENGDEEDSKKRKYEEEGKELKDKVLSEQTINKHDKKKFKTVESYANKKSFSQGHLREVTKKPDETRPESETFPAVTQTERSSRKQSEKTGKSPGGLDVYSSGSSDSIIPIDGTAGRDDAETKPRKRRSKEPSENRVSNLERCGISATSWDSDDGTEEEFCDVTDLKRRRLSELTEKSKKLGKVRKQPEVEEIENSESRGEKIGKSKSMEENDQFGDEEILEDRVSEEYLLGDFRRKSTKNPFGDEEIRGSSKKPTKSWTIGSDYKEKISDEYLLCDFKRIIPKNSFGDEEIVGNGKKSTRFPTIGSGREDEHLLGDFKRKSAKNPFGDEEIRSGKKSAEKPKKSVSTGTDREEGLSETNSTGKKNTANNPFSEEKIHNIDEELMKKLKKSAEVIRNIKEKMCEENLSRNIGEIKELTKKAEVICGEISSVKKQFGGEKILRIDEEMTRKPNRNRKSNESFQNKKGTKKDLNEEIPGCSKKSTANFHGNSQEGTSLENPKKKKVSDGNFASLHDRTSRKSFAENGDFKRKLTKSPIGDDEEILRIDEKLTKKVIKTRISIAKGIFEEAALIDENHNKEDSNGETANNSQRGISSESFEENISLKRRTKKKKDKFDDEEILRIDEELNKKSADVITENSKKKKRTREKGDLLEEIVRRAKKSRTLPDETTSGTVEETVDSAKRKKTRSRDHDDENDCGVLKVSKERNKEIIEGKDSKRKQKKDKEMNDLEENVRNHNPIDVNLRISTLKKFGKKATEISAIAGIVNPGFDPLYNKVSVEKHILTTIKEETMESTGLDSSDDKVSVEKPASNTVKEETNDPIKKRIRSRVVVEYDDGIDNPSFQDASPKTSDVNDGIDNPCFEDNRQAEKEPVDDIVLDTDLMLNVATTPILKCEKSSSRPSKKNVRFSNRREERIIPNDYVKERNELFDINTEVVEQSIMDERRHENNGFANNGFDVRSVDDLSFFEVVPDAARTGGGVDNAAFDGRSQRLREKCETMSRTIENCEAELENDINELRRSDADGWRDDVLVGGFGAPADGHRAVPRGVLLSFRNVRFRGTPRWPAKQSETQAKRAYKHLIKGDITLAFKSANLHHISGYGVKSEAIP